MLHNAAFHQGLHCFLRLKQLSGAEIHHNLENSTCDPLKYKTGNNILISFIRIYWNIHLSEYKGLTFQKILSGILSVPNRLDLDQTRHFAESVFFFFHAYSFCYF